MALNPKGTYRASLETNGEIHYVRGSFRDVLDWLEKNTRGLPENTYTATISPVKFLLPWERRRD